MFKTTLFKALEAADSIRVHNYTLSNFDYSADRKRVTVWLDDSEDGTFLFEDQEIEVTDQGDVLAIPCFDDENEDWGGILDQDTDAPEQGVWIELKISRPLTASDIREASHAAR